MLRCKYGCKMLFRLKSFNDLVIEDALKVTIARVFSRSPQIPINIGNTSLYFYNCDQYKSKQYVSSNLVFTPHGISLK